MNNIYIDGSYDHSNKLIGIGIYNSTTKFELAMVKDGKNVSEAEYEALEECLRYCKLNGITEQSRIFTDSKEIHNAYYEYVKREGIREFIWIPRELNKKADALSSEYKQYTKSTRTKISFDSKCVIKTTKIKEIQETKTLNKEQIIDILNESLYGNILSSMIFSSFPPSSGNIGRKLYDTSNLFILLIIL